ncbi:MAG: PQQ-binding-like beta-propeller repeat protein [Chloroflexi bacterium]|nr:PQQ-binding-like beta-propeller repeat protein [Chloroflexota bacterium]
MRAFDTQRMTGQIAGRNPEGQLEPGTTLQNRYLILGILGVGGMGSVYRARDLHFPNVTKLVAVKEMINMAPDPALREMIVRNFEREADILATLSHPAIPKIYDYFTAEDHSYLTQELINGKDLEAMLNESSGFMPEGQVIEWAVQLCEVLSYLHGHTPQAIVFRDMKPSNVMIDDRGHVRLIDFGIAKGFQAGQRGTMIGTEGYSPPEQYRGEASPAGDLYALGATLHHLLTKQDPRLEPPFSFNERPIRKANPSVSPELDLVVMTALAYNASDRFAAAPTMREALLAVKNKATTAAATPAKSAVIMAHTAPPPPSPTEATKEAAAASEVVPVWAFECEDEVRGSPLVVEGVVYVGCYDQNLYAINADAGKFLWKYATEGGLAASPAFHGNYVFIGSEDKRLYCLTAKTGRISWTYYADAPIRGTGRVAHEHIFFGADDSYLHAVNVQTGRRAWRAEATGPVRSTPAVNGERVFFGCESGEMYCVDFSGAIKWRFKAKRAVTSGPALGDDLVFIGSMDWAVYALEAASGWAVWRYRTNKPIVSSPCVNRTMVYVGSADGALYAFETRSGKMLWRFETAGQVNSSPLFYNGAVYFSSVDGHLYSVDAGNGKLRWKFRSGGPMTSSPVEANGLIYVGSTDHKVYALTA